MQIADTVEKAGIKNRGKELIFKQKKSPYFIEEEEGKDRTNPGGFVQRVLESEPKHLAGVPPCHGLVPVCGLLGTRPHSRR